jgi:hypothetical protein
MGARRLIAVGLVVLACAAVGGTALAATASGGRHLPYFSLLNERVAIRKLPIDLRIPFSRVPGVKELNSRHPTRGPVWFGEVERPNATILAAGSAHWVCESEQSRDELGGGGGGCTTLAATRELFDLNVSSCGKGPAQHFRIAGLVPNGVTALAIEKSDGTMGRTLPVIENTVAFTVGREDIALHGVGDAAAERLERRLPLTHLFEPGNNRSGCSGYIFAEAKAPN